MTNTREIRCEIPSPTLDDEQTAGECDGVELPTSEELHEFLADSTIFHGLPRKTLERLNSIARTKAVSSGCTLFLVGETCDALHLLYAGTGLLAKTASGGRQRILHRAVPGETVGAVAFFDGKGFPATFTAEVDCLFVSFPRDGLLRLLARFPELSMAIIGGIASQVREMVGLVEQASFEDTTRRLWKYLLESSRGEGDDTFPRVIDSLPTREHIARVIGTVREVVSRRLSLLVVRGYVIIDGRRLTLLRPRD